MGRLSSVSPVSPTLALEFAGSSPLRRKVFVRQCRIGTAIALFVDGIPAVLAMFDHSRARRAEMAVHFRPIAAGHMRQVIRFGQLTLGELADTGILVHARIAPTNRQGQRVAMLTGFVPGGFKDPAIWLFRG